MRRYLIAFTSLALVGALLVGGYNFFRDPLEKARTAFDKGDLAAARIEAANAIQKNENDAEAHLLLGSILDAQGDLVTAERVLRRGVTLGLERARVDPLLARILLRTGQFKQILEDLNAGPGHQGDARAIVLAARGQALLSQEQLEQAKTSLEQALEAVPDLPEALIGQAQLAYIQKDPAQAMALIERVLATRPAHAEAWGAKARLLMLTGKTEEAIAAFAEAAKADTVNPAPELAAAELLMGAGRFDEARTHIQRVRKRVPDFLPARHLEAAWHFQQRQYDQALGILQAARKLSPGFVPVVQLLAMTHLARGNPNQAEEVLRALVQAQPENDQARRLYVTTLVRQGKSKAALDALAPALAAAPEDPVWLNLAADAHASAREFSKAVEYLERTARAPSGDASTLARLGMLRLAAGDATGLRQLEQAVGANKKGIEPDFSLAVVLMERREYTKALQVARGIQAKQPDNPIGFNLAGAAQVALNDRAAATQSYRQALNLDASYWPAARSLMQLEVDAGKPDTARKIVETYVAKEPGNVEAHYVLLHFTGDNGRFVAGLEAARRADAKALAPRLALASSYSASGLGEAALTVAREALAIAPADAKALQALGSAQLAAGKRAEALETFRRLATDQPKSARAQLLLAQTQAALGDFNGAEAALKRALTLAPNDPEATGGLARLHTRAGRHAEAMQLAEELKAHFPKSGVGHALAGDLWLAQKNLPQALKAYDAALALAPSGMVLLKRHQTAVDLGQDPGIAPLEQWLARHPYDVQVRFHLGTLHYAASRYQAAIEQFRAIVDADPQHAFALNNLAAAYLKTKDKRALQAAQAAHALLPDNASILDTLGVALTRVGRAGEGAEMLKKAVARHPDSIEFNVNYALALAQSGERAAGRAVLQKLTAKGAKPELDADARALLESR